MKLKSSSLRMNALMMLAGLVLGGIVSGMATFIALTIFFFKTGWIDTLTVVSVMVIAGCVIGAISGAALGSEITSERRRRFG